MKKSKSYFIYGHHSVKAALLNQYRDIIKFYYCDDNILYDLAKKRDIPCERLDKNTFKKFLTQHAKIHGNHQFCLCEVMNLSTMDINHLIEDKENIHLVICDRITDPHNIGTILRNAHIFGIDGLIMQDRQSPSEYTTISHVASGAVEYVPIYHVVNLARTIEMLKKNDFWVIGFHENGQYTLDNIALSSKMAYILGSEGSGMRPLVEKSCDMTAHIDMADNHIGSLNVSAASAVIFHHFYQKRNAS